jgi:hypothetical protein
MPLPAFLALALLCQFEGPFGAAPGAGGGPGSDTTALHNGGDTTGATLVVGPDDAQDMDLQTSGTTRFVLKSTGPLLAVGDGTAAAPILSWSADPDTGLYHAVNQLGLSVGGSGRLLLTTSGMSDPSSLDCVASGNGLLPGGVCFNDAQGVTINSTFGTSSGVGMLTLHANTNGNHTMLGITNHNDGNDQFGIMQFENVGSATTVTHSLNWLNNPTTTQVGGIISVGILAASDAAVSQPALRFIAARDAGSISGPSRTNLVNRLAFAFTDATSNSMLTIAPGGVVAFGKEQVSTVADDGAGTNAAANLDVTSSTVTVVCNDTNGCDVTIQETTVAAYTALTNMALYGARIVVCNSPDSVSTANFPDNAGQFNGKASALTPGSCLTMTYVDAANDIFLQTGVSIN